MNCEFLVLRFADFETHKKQFNGISLNTHYVGY